MSFSPTFLPGASQRESTLTLNVNHTFSAREKALRSQEEDGNSMGWKEEDKEMQANKVDSERA